MQERGECLILRIENSNVNTPGLFCYLTSVPKQRVDFVSRAVESNQITMCFFPPHYCSRFFQVVFLKGLNNHHYYSENIRKNGLYVLNF